MAIEFISEWTIINLTRGIKDEEIVTWLKGEQCARLPKCFRFICNPHAQVETSDTIYGKWPISVAEGGICIVDFDSDVYPVAVDHQAAGLGYWKRPSVRYIKGDNGLEMGSRIFHEMCHAMGTDVDLMDSIDKLDFIDWVKKDGEKYLPKKWLYVANVWCNTGYHPGGDGHNYLLMSYYTYIISRDYPWCLEVVVPGSGPSFPPLLPTFFAALAAIIKKIFKL